MLRQFMAVAALAITGGVALSYAKNKEQPVIVEVGYGASIHGPLQVHDPAGNLVLDVSAGSSVNVLSAGLRTAH
jgi:hypothetical protein